MEQLLKVEIKYIKHPGNSPYSYATTRKAEGVVYHLIFHRKDGIGISIRDKVVADIDSSYLNCVSIVRDDAMHIYALQPAYDIGKLL